jgi:hypothetical protein
MSSVDRKIQLDLKQDEYFTLLFDMINHTEGLITKNKPYSYWWERLKELQMDIIVYTTIHREQSLETAKEQLERAFTPRIKEMLSKKLQQEKENESTGD